MERYALKLRCGVPQRVLDAALRHLVATNPGHQSWQLRSFGNALADQGRGDEIGNYVPGSVSGFRIVSGRLAGGHLSPPTGAIDYDFHQKNSAILHGTETCFKRRLQLHAYFTKCDRFNVHKAPGRSCLVAPQKPAAAGSGTLLAHESAAMDE